MGRDVSVRVQVAGYALLASLAAVLSFGKAGALVSASALLAIGIASSIFKNRVWWIIDFGFKKWGLRLDRKGWFLELWAFSDEQGVILPGWGLLIFLVFLLF